MPEQDSAGADLAPLGFAAFAITMFALGVHNAGLATDASWVGLAVASGGLALLVAGIWQFRTRNALWATAFSGYGAFWLALGTYVLLLGLGRVPMAAVGTSLGYLFLGFAIFNLYLLLASARTNVAIFGVFLVLEVTEIILFLGFLSNTDALIRLGGWLGILTSLVAWYTSAAGVVNSLGTGLSLWTGTPIWTEQRSGSERDRTSGRR